MAESSSNRTSSRRKPSPYQAVIEALLKAPHDQLLDELKKHQQLVFFKKDILENWSEVILKFDEVLKEANLKHLQRVSDSPPISIFVCSPSFPTELVLLILQFSQQLVENCTRQAKYTLSEHLAQLLLVDNLDILENTLKVLLSFVVEYSEYPVELDTNIQKILYSLLLGCSGLSLLDCCVERRDQLQIPLHFAYFKEPTEGNLEVGHEGRQDIHLEGSELGNSSGQILQELISRLEVPEQFHYPLFARIRLAKGFPEILYRRKFVNIRLLAFAILGRIPNEPPHYYASFIRSEPDFLQELMELISTDEIIPDDVRSMSVKCLTTLPNRLVATTESGQLYGALPSVVRKSLTALTSSLSIPNHNVKFLDDLFSLLLSLCATEEGCASLKSSGLISSILPLVIHPSVDTLVLGVTAKCAQLVAVLMETDETLMDLIPEMGGVEYLFRRLKLELGQAQEGDASAQLARRKLVHSLLDAISFCVQVSPNVTAILESDLPLCLAQVLKSQQQRVDGRSLSLVGSIIGSILQSEPTCFPALETTGLIDLYLSSLNLNVLKSSRLLSATPSALGALCLNETGCKKVQEAKIVELLFSVFSSTDHIPAVKKSAESLGNGLDGVFRYHAYLRDIGASLSFKLLEDTLSTQSLVKQEDHCDFISNVVKFLGVLLQSGEFIQAALEKGVVPLFLKLWTLPHFPVDLVPSLNGIFHILSSHNIGSVLHSLIGQMSDEFKVIDSMVPRNGEFRFIKRMNDNLELRNAMTRLQKYVSVASLVRDGPSHSTSAMLSALNEFTMVSGTGTFVKLAELHRHLVFEMASEQSKEGLPLTCGYNCAVQLAENIHNLTKGLLKLSTSSSRRRGDKNLANLIQAVARVLSDHLTWYPQESSTKDRCAYLGNIMLEAETMLYFDHQRFAHTQLLHAFYNIQGLQHLLNCFKFLLTELIESQSKEELTVSTDAPEYSSLIKCLNLLFLLSDDSRLLSSPLTANMLTQQVTGEKGPFDPHKFAQEIHSEIFHLTVSVWSDTARKILPADVVSLIVKILNNILRFRQAGKSREQPDQPFQPDPAVVEQLVLMGFSQPHAERALRQIGNNHTEMATEWLLNNPDTEPAEAVSEEDELERALAMSLEPTSQSSTETAENEFMQTLPEDILSLVNRKEPSLAVEVGQVLSHYCKQNEAALLKIIEFITSKIQEPEQNPKFIATLFSLLRQLLQDESLSRTILQQNSVTKQLLVNIIPQTIHQLRAELEAKEKGSRVSDLVLGMASLLCCFSNQQSMEESILTPEHNRELLGICLYIVQNSLEQDTSVVKIALELCTSLTQNYELALTFHKEGGLIGLLQLAKKHISSEPSILQLISGTIRHTMEDPTTLQAAMETEIIDTVKSLRSHNQIKPAPFLQMLAPVLHRNPDLFLRAVSSTCRFVPGTTHICLVEDEAKAKQQKRHSIELKQVTYLLITTLVEVYQLECSEKSSERQGLSSFDLIQLLCDFSTSYPAVASVLSRQRPKDSVPNFISFLLENFLPETDSGKEATLKLVLELGRRPEGRRRVITEMAELLAKYTQQDVALVQSHKRLVQSIFDTLNHMFTANQDHIAGDIQLIRERKLVDCVVSFLQNCDFSNPRTPELLQSAIKFLDTLCRTALDVPDFPADTNQSEDSQPILQTAPTNPNALSRDDPELLGEEEEEEGEEEIDEEEGESDDEHEEFVLPTQSSGTHLFGNVAPGIQILQELFPTGLTFDIDLQSRETPLVALMNRVRLMEGFASSDLNSRRLGEGLRHSLGRRGVQSSSNLQRWVGRQNVSGITDFAATFESKLIDLLSKITNEENSKERVKESETTPEQPHTLLPEQPLEMQTEGSSIPSEQPTQLEQPADQTQAQAPSLQTESELVQEVQQETSSVVEEKPAEPSAVESNIDPAFLDALPEELRAEVLSSQLAQQSTQTSNVSTSSINPEFLAALPLEIQAEVLEQERSEQLRKERESAQPADISRAEEMDNASFIATLPPELREEVLLSQDESFIASLPPQLAAEAHTLRERAFRSRLNWRRTVATEDSVARAPAPSMNRKGQSILKVESIRWLIKLLYTQQSLNRTVLHRLFLKLCSHETTRLHIMKCLISVLRYYGLSADELHKLQIPTPSILGFPGGILFSVSDPNTPPLLISKRVMDLLVFLIKNNPYAAKQLVDPELVNLSKDGFSTLLDLLNLSAVRSNTSQVESLLGTLSALVKALQTQEPKSQDSSEEQKSPTLPDELLISPGQVKNLIGVLKTSALCSESTFKQFLSIIGFLAKYPQGQTIMDTVVSEAQSLASQVEEKFEKICKELKNGSTIPPVLFSSPQPEITLLGLLKVTAKIVPDPHKVLDLESLWMKFEQALDTLHSLVSEEIFSVSTPLLPLIEAFFVANARVDLSQSQNPFQAKFIRFAERYRKLLNDLIKQSTALLHDSFSILLKIPQLIEFENKRTYFKAELRTRSQDDYGEIRLCVRRDRVMEDSFYQLRARKPEEMRGKLSVHFTNEEGIDAGGLSREWYTILAREMFNPGYCLFTHTADSAYQPNKNSAINPDHFDYFKFIGSVIGKALTDGFLLDAHFTRSFYKHMLGLPVVYTDMEAVDPEYYKSLQYILEHDPEDLDLTFSAQQEGIGTMTVVDLKPGGRNIPVSNENKEEYVRLITEMKMTTAIRAQIDSFLQGFHELVPRELISIFTPSELELLISGLPDIDIEDLRKNTEYRGYSIDSPIIKWFWQIVGEFSREEKALLLQFVTGTSKVPLRGFKELQGMSGLQKFQIFKTPNVTRLPSAHTCFNQLDLPEYSSFDLLKKNLLITIHEGSEGFGFG